MNTAVRIPEADPLAGYQANKEEIDRAIARVLSGGQYILGDEVAAFEVEFAAYIGVRFGVGVGSGTEALRLALSACGVGRGDEVITVAHTAVATVSAIELCGATPVLVDIEPTHLTMDVQQLTAAITTRTKAVVPVHLYGQPAEIDAILTVCKHHGLWLVEDCAQSHGAYYKGKRTGAWGHIAAFSFYPTKNLGAMGDGGMVVTDDPELAERLRLLREYGWRQRYVSEVPGSNSRLDELQAAILRVKLHHLDAENAARTRAAQYYSELLSQTSLVQPQIRPGTTHVFHQYVVRSTRRQSLCEYLWHRGIGTAIHYPVPVHLQPAYRGRLSSIRSLPQTEHAAAEVLSLPMFAQITSDQVRRVAGTIVAWDRESQR